MLKNAAVPKPVVFSLFKNAARVNNPTIAAEDFKVDIDGAGQANVANPPTSDAAGRVTWQPTQAETNGDIVTLLGNDAAGDEWEPVTLVFETQLPTSVEAILGDTAEIGAAGAGLTALGDARLANLDAAVSSRATPSDVAVSLAISTTEAAAVASGAMALTLYGSFDQTIESDTTEDLSMADALIWAVKTDRKRDEDNEALVLVDVDTGLRYLARAAYTGAAANGSITLGGGVGAWEIRCQLAAGITGELAQWANRGLDAQIKAIFGDRTVNVWEGTARINHQTIREV